MYTVRVEAPCRPTEDPAKVMEAIRNLFPDAELSREEGIVGRNASLDRLAQLLRDQQIRDSAREVLRGALRGGRLVFRLNKQAAFAGKVSFSAHGPLGDLTVVVEGDDLPALVDRVAPRSPESG